MSRTPPSDPAVSPLSPPLIDAIVAVLLRAEARSQADGWAHDPVLYGMFVHGTGPEGILIDLDPRLGTPDLWRLPDPEHPGSVFSAPVVLDRMTRTLANCRTVAAVAGYLSDWLHSDGRRCIGFAFVFTAWVSAPYPEYRYGDLNATPAKADDEAGVLAAIDVDGRLYQIVRRRSQPEPTVTVFADPPEFARDTTIVAALTRLTRTAQTL
jgi:hypothetical protein